MEISGKTEVYGIIGQPVTHSLSPVFQDYFFRISGVDAAYVAFPVDSEAVDAAVRGLWAAGVRGLNVTVPHKAAVLPLVETTEEAELIGAVNTLVRGAQGWHGHNTDWKGFAALLDGLQVRLDGADVLMFGAGGTARAVVHALAKLGVRRLAICNRGQARGRELLAHVKSHYTGMQCELIDWEQSAVDAWSEHCAAAINVTSIGLDRGEMFPFELKGRGTAVDAVYQPDGKTAFCRMAGAAGWRISDGLPMLIAQGAEAFTLWRGSRRPDMLDTLRRMEERLKRPVTEMPGWEATR